MTDSGRLPDQAVTAAAVALHDAECSDRHCSGSALGAFYERAKIVLNAAAEAIRADERKRMRDEIERVERLAATARRQAVTQAVAAEHEHTERAEREASAAAALIVSRSDRIAELERHVAVLEVRHAETDEAVRADERKRWLAAIECPSPCDEDCELRPDGCHEEHDVPTHRTHNPFQCSEIRLAIAAAVTAERGRLSAVIGPERFRKLADWFDTDDEFKVAMFPETWPERAHEVQDDLRKFADLLEGDS